MTFLLDSAYQLSNSLGSDATPLEMEARFLDWQIRFPGPVGGVASSTPPAFVLTPGQGFYGASMAMRKLYLVPWTIQRFSGDLCWGSCGLGQPGAVSIDVGRGVVECIPCREDACPHEERTMEDACGEVQGEPVYLRKLKEKKPNVSGPQGTTPTTQQK